MHVTLQAQNPVFTSKVEGFTMKWLLMFFLCFIHASWGEIQQVSHWSPIQQSIENSPNETWVVFDVDNVLLVLEEPILHPAHKKLFSSYATRLFEKLDHESLMELWGVLFSSVQPRLIDPKVFEVLSLIEEKKMPSFALTNCGTGKVGCIEHFEDWRIKHLQNLGIQFEKLSPYNGELMLKELAWKKGTPIFKQGVIFACYRDKGVVFSTVLDALKKQPKALIFIDDKLENLKSVEATCLKRDIQFLGFEYAAVTHAEPPPLNQELVDTQFYLLESTKRWVSYKELDSSFEKHNKPR